MLNSIMFTALKNSGLRLFSVTFLVSVALSLSSFAQAPAGSPPPKYGKYSCTASKYRNGSYEFIPRGSFVISKDGMYTYQGFEKPSSGTYTVDKNGNLAFKGGYLNGGTAEKMDRPNRFYLVFPANPDSRWTCTWQAEK